MTLDFHSWVVNHSVEDSENHYPRLFDDTLQWWFPDDGHTLNGVHQGRYQQAWVQRRRAEDRVDDPGSKASEEGRPDQPDGQMTDGLRGVGHHPGSVGWPHVR
jgi:hypothetical protein